MRKPATIRKSEIVASVLSLADQLGPDRVTTGAVAAAIGITQAALFKHFPTKSALWMAVADHVALRLRTAWSEASQAEGGPIARLRALIVVQFALIEDAPALPMLLLSRELSVGNVELRQAFQGLLSSFHAHLQHEFQAADAAGLCADRVGPADAAMLVSSLVQGTAIRWTLGGRGFALRDEGTRLADVYLGLLTRAEG